MKSIYIEDIVRAVMGKQIQTGDKDYITGVSTDSRTIETGSLFVPLVGERYNGHHFLQSAVSKGAAAVLTQEKITFSGDIHVILVDDTLKAMQRLAAYYLRSLRIPVVAVTGSTGKTTTKDMIYDVLSQRYHCLKTQGNYNNEIGLPLTIFQLEEDYQVAILEMGMSGFGEIKRLVHIAPPTIGIITNIGVSHIEKLGSRENILKAKMEVFDTFKSECMAILNGDDILLKNAGGNLDYPVTFFGMSDDVSYKAYNVNIKGEDGIEYMVDIDGEPHLISLRTPGRHNVYNSLAAIAVGLFYGMGMDEIKTGLWNFESGKMRLHVFVTDEGIKVIDDVYNASPDSMNAALDILKNFKGNRKIAVLGDMFELGPFSEEAHRSVGEAVAMKDINLLVTVGHDSEYTTDQAIRSGMSADMVYHFDNNHDTIKWMETTIASGDTVLVKGSRGMKMEEIVIYIKERRGNI